MKKLLTIMLVMMGVVAIAATEKKKGITLADARARIDLAIEKPAAMELIVKNLSAADQKTFVAEVNTAIAKLPASAEEKTAKCLNATRAALRGAAKGNMAAIVAEVFATAPVESLTVINERLAADAFNRAANPAVTYTDEQFTKIAKDLMKVVVARLESAEDSGVRAGFAALMMIRASNNETEQLRNELISTLPASVQDTARNEWFSPALAEGSAQSYEPMLGMATEPDLSTLRDTLVLRIAGPQSVDALLNDLSGDSTGLSITSATMNPVYDSTVTPLIYELPGLQNGGMGEVAPLDRLEAAVKEPKGYQGQAIY